MERLIKTKKLILFAALLASALLGGASIYFVVKNTGPNSLPDITLETPDGRPFALSTLRGKPLLVVFWASTCEICIQEMPALIRLHNEYAPQGLEIVGIVIYYDNKDNALAMVSNMPIPYRILLDRDKKATQAFRNVHYTPTTFLIAPNGSIVYRHFGRTDFNFIRKQTDKLLTGSLGTL